MKRVAEEAVYVKQEPNGRSHPMVLLQPGVIKLANRDGSSLLLEAQNNNTF